MSVRTSQRPGWARVHNETAGCVAHDTDSGLLQCQSNRALVPWGRLKRRHPATQAAGGCGLSSNSLKVYEVLKSHAKTSLYNVSSSHRIGTSLI